MLNFTLILNLNNKIIISKQHVLLQFITYSQFESSFHILNVTIYHSNLVNLVQNTQKIYKNASQNIGIKIPQTISHNYIKIKEIKIIGQKHENTKALNFINQFASGHQLVRQTQQSYNYNPKRRVTIQ